ncbi:MAG: type II secretion system F family protein [Candidatus Colwellbacteria bacterium]|nr:type II secretion system F family protein [Candidatus Colwellbacteria bacterium]
MRFHYIATDAKNNAVEGDLEAGAPSEVLEWMGKQGLRPVSLKSLGAVETRGVKGVFSESITTADKVFLTKYLALMLRVGTDLFSAIDILIADFEKPSVKTLLLEIKDALSRGQPFYTTFEKYPKYFSAVFTNLIRAGEVSGNLDQIFEDLSRGLEKEQQLRNKIKSALIYPVVLVFLSLVILFLMITFALPRIAETFLSAGIEPPLFSKIVFSIGLFLGHNAFAVLLFLVSAVFGSWFFFFKNFLGQRILRRTLVRLPVVSEIIYRIALQRFASTLSSLLRSGMPILEAMEITAKTVGNPDMEATLIRISREGIAKGLTIGEAFHRETYFPRVVVNLIAISEKSGHLESILETLSEFYESEIDSSLKILISFLEPVLLLIIGMIVGVIALAIIIPVYQLVGKV